MPGLSLKSDKLAIAKKKLKSIKSMPSAASKAHHHHESHSFAADDFHHANGHFNDSSNGTTNLHPDPKINLMIKHLRTPPEKRLKSDLTEIIKFVNNLSFFKMRGIKGNDILEISELMTYCHHE